MIKKIGNVTLYHGNSEEILKTLDSESVNIVMIDPPYHYDISLYKGRSFDDRFDKKVIFTELERILKQGGFINCFGRGDSFYENNLIMKKLGLKFKEEIIWHKNNFSSYVCNLQRIHETIVIRSKGKNKGINKCYNDCFDNLKEGDVETIFRKLKSFFDGLRTLLNKKDFDIIRNYLENNIYTYCKKVNKFKVVSTVRFKPNGAISFLNTLIKGKVETSLIFVPKEVSYIHPTQKPKELIKRLLRLVLAEDNDNIVLDCFAGSGSTGVACIELGIPCILIEKNLDFYNIACEEVQKAYDNKKLELL